MRFTLHDQERLHGQETACLDQIFQDRYGHLSDCPKCGKETKFYKVENRKCYSCKWCGYQLHPLAGTIFHKSSTPLTLWFKAMYLFSVSKNGVSASELQRVLGVTPKTAWRMAKQIRLLMEQDDDQLDGTVEVDEMEVGGKSGVANMHRSKSSVVGAVERGGRVKAQVISGASNTTVIPFLRDSVARNSTLYSDGARMYQSSHVKQDFDHEFVNHARKEFARGGVHINTIEGFWGQVKRSIAGTYIGVSPKYLQGYINYFVWQYNHRGTSSYPSLVSTAAKRVG